MDVRCKGKLRGGYYTPQAITEFICKWIINKNTKNILEPSCGDGNFLKAIVERQEKLNLNLDITGVELCLDEAKKAMRYGTNVECQDFFAFYRDKVTGKRLNLEGKIFNDIMDVWLFEYDGEVDLGNATTDEVAQVAWMNREQIKELFDANMFVDTLEYFFTEVDK